MLWWHCDACHWDGDTPALQEWVGEGCGGVVWTLRVCPKCGEEVSVDSPEPLLRPSLATGHDAEMLGVEDPHLGYNSETFLDKPP
jgi:hypothetical protein